MALYWKNTDPRKFVNVVPTSAITGEGIPDLLQLLTKLSQSMMAERLALINDTQARARPPAAAFRCCCRAATPPSLLVAAETTHRLTPRPQRLNHINPI